MLDFFALSKNGEKDSTENFTEKLGGLRKIEMLESRFQEIEPFTLGIKNTEACGLYNWNPCTYPGLQFGRSAVWQFGSLFRLWKVSFYPTRFFF